MPAPDSTRQATWRDACASMPALQAAHSRVVAALRQQPLPVAGQVGLNVVCDPLPPPDGAAGVASTVTLRVAPQGHLAGPVRADPMALPLATRGVSVVEVVFALEGVDEPHTLLSELARCLRAEGYLRVVGLSRAAPLAWRHPALWRCALGAQRISTHLQDCGLTLVQSGRIGATSPLLAPAWVLLARRRIPAGTRVGRVSIWRPSGLGVPVRRSAADNGARRERGAWDVS